jgi:hypothetical protein
VGARSAARRPRGPALAALAVFVAVVLTACGSDSRSDAGPDAVDTGSSGQVATISYQGRVYLVSCDAVAASLLGPTLQVAPEQASGQLSQARSVTGVDPAEGFATQFSNAVCGRRGPEWVAAIAADVARSDPARTRSILDVMRSG